MYNPSPVEQNPVSRFESDTQRIVRLHLRDKHHVITDEELRNLRIGMTPPVTHALARAIDEGRRKNGHPSA